MAWRPHALACAAHPPPPPQDGNLKIDKFVDDALELYKAQQASKIDHARYLYIPVLTGWAARPSSSDETSKAPTAIYKRYKLSEEKTFASFFHPDKDSILHLIDQFLNKKGKFGIPGYPQKLVRDPFDLVGEAPRRSQRADLEHN